MSETRALYEAGRPTQKGDATNPIMSPEEWRDRTYKEPGQGMVSVFDGEITTDDGVEFKTARPVALAALLLAQAPECFTHDDVRHLRGTADSLPTGTIRQKALYDLADRIAALLPPTKEQG